MNYTLTQAIDRAKDLSGIIKAARAHEADCAADHEAKKNIAEIAGEAHNKAIGACIDLEREREALAEHIAALVRKVGEPLDVPLADETGPAPEMIVLGETGASVGYNSIFTEGADFQAQAMQNGLHRIGEIVDEARR